MARNLETYEPRENPTAPLWLNGLTNHLNERLSWTAWNRTQRDCREALLKSRYFCRLWL
jgi:hypothetical protein